MENSAQEQAGASWGNSYIPSKNTEKLPNVTTALVLAILSIFLCCCYGLPGLIASIVALYLANNALKLNRLNPETYNLKDVSNAGVARIIAIIGIAWSSIGTVYYIFNIILAIIDPSRNERNRRMLEELFK